MESAYDEVSEEYEQGRPAYAADAVRHATAELRIGQGSAVVDLGAGTGKLTRALAAAGLTVTAVDPSRAMLDRLCAANVGTHALVATAEAIPLPDENVDAVFAGQAFHWFDAARALPEMHRVLRSSGGLALLWNKRDDGDPVQRVLAELTSPAERQEQRGWQLDVPAILGRSALFQPPSVREFRHVQQTSDEALVSRLRSSSFVAALPPARRLELEDELRERLGALGPIHELVLTTVVYVARRRAASSR